MVAYFANGRIGWVGVNRPSDRPPRPSVACDPPAWERGPSLCPQTAAGARAVGTVDRSRACPRRPLLRPRPESMPVQLKEIPNWLAYKAVLEGNRVKKPARRPTFRQVCVRPPTRTCGSRSSERTRRSAVSPGRGGISP
jgi:hypothetical protein